MANGAARNFGPITGLSEFTRAEGFPVVLGTGLWVPVLEITNIQKTIRITGLRIGLTGPTPTGPMYRISAKRQVDDDYRVVAPPDPEGQDVVSGRIDGFVQSIHLPKGASYRVEIYTTTAPGGSTAQVSFLNLIEFTP